MRCWEVKFELYGKKMKTKINAGSRDEAKERIRNKVIFHDVILQEDDKVIEHLKNMMGWH